MKYLRACIYGLSTLLLYLGVPLLGWGLDDLGGFGSSTPRAGYMLAAALLAVAVGVQAIDSPEGIDGGPGEKGKMVARQRLVALAMVIFLYLSLFLLPFLDRRTLLAWVLPAPVQWAGTVACALAYALIFWSGLALGRQYSPDVTIQ